MRDKHQKELRLASEDTALSVERVKHLLTWADITDKQREQLTIAANALEVALECFSFRGPERHVTIGF